MGGCRIAPHNRDRNAAFWCYGEASLHLQWTCHQPLCQLEGVSLVQPHQGNGCFLNYIGKDSVMCLCLHMRSPLHTLTHTFMPMRICTYGHACTRSQMHSCLHRSEDIMHSCRHILNHAFMLTRSCIARDSAGSVHVQRQAPILASRQT